MNVALILRIGQTASILGPLSLAMALKTKLILASSSPDIQTSIHAFDLSGLSSLN